MKELINYFENLESNDLPNSDISHIIERDFLTNNTFVYLHDFLKSEIQYVKGLKHVLGYENDSFTIQELHDLIHPDDRVSVFNMSKFVIEQIVKHKLKPNAKKDLFMLSYRMKHCTDGYVRILRESVILDIDTNNMPIRSLSVCKKFNADLVSNKVVMETEGDFAHIVNYESYISEHGHNHKGIFSSREMEILSLMAKGKAIKHIADMLFRSEKTVINHRSNMFIKANVQSAAELIIFAQKKGII